MRRSSSSDRIRGSFKKYFTFCSISTDFIKVSLQWSWLKNQFVLTILVVNRTSCGERGVLQTEVLKVPELPDGTQVSLQWWIFVRAGRPVGPVYPELVIHRWQPQQTRPLPDDTDTGQGRIMRTTFSDDHILMAQNLQQTS